MYKENPFGFDSLISSRNWIRSAVYYLLVTAVLGLFLRYAFVGNLPDWFHYKNIQHAHSHVGMLGWLSASFYALMMLLFDLKKKIYRQLFWGLQGSVLGMLLSFPVQGYGAVSIFFSTIFMLLTYVFIWNAYPDLRAQAQNLTSRSKNTAVKFACSALFFLGLSTTGVWALGAVMAMGARGSAWYYGAVQFFLHFQFNGWFIFSLFALTFRILDMKQIHFSDRDAGNLYRYLVISCFFTFALSITWSTPENFLFWMNTFGVVVQAIALIYFIRVLKDIRQHAFQIFERWLFGIWGIAFFGLGLKILIQTLVAIPHLAVVSYTIRNFVVGFIHLLMLGSLSIFLFGVFRFLGYPISRAGIIVFAIGVLLTEVLLFGQGLLLWFELGFIPYYDQYLFYASVIIFIGAVFLVRALEKVPAK